MPLPKVQILVCANERPPEAEKPSCGPRGGADLYRRFKDRIRELGLRDEMIVTRTGCLKHCSLGITVGVWPHNHWYGGVTEADVDEIVTRSQAGEEPIERLLIPQDAPWE